MSHRIDDRWLWLGFGVFFLLAAGGVRYAIKDVIQLTRLERYRDESADAQREKPEDNISLDDLKTLTESSNANIANAAISLVLDRFMRQPDAYKSLKKDLDSKDEATRIRARQARDFLREWGSMTDSTLSGFPRSRSNSGESGRSRYNWNLPERGRFLFNEDHQADPPAAPGFDVVIPSDDNPVAGWTNVPRERPQDGEAERRRRRREAMVLREGEGGVEESDIIRPNLAG